MSKVFGSDTYSAGNRTSDVGYIKNKEVFYITVNPVLFWHLKYLYGIFVTISVLKMAFLISVRFFKFINNGYIKVALPKQIAVKR